MRIVDNDGRPIDANFSIERHSGHFDVIIHSRGGTRGASGTKNVEYTRGLELILERAKALGGRILDAAVDSARTESLPIAQRRLKLDSAYPLDLNSVADPAQLRRAMGRAQTRVTSNPGTTKGGGNSTRRIRLCLRMEGLPSSDAAEWERILANDSRASAIHRERSLLASNVAESSRTEEALGAFDPKNDADGRRMVYRSLALRQGQAGFRSQLLRAYGGRCAVTGCALEPILEAAHVLPYRGTHTNHVQNGLLLRTDIHTLFDRSLLAIDAPAANPTSWRVAIAPVLVGSDYEELAGSLPRVPPKPAERPSVEAIVEHRRRAAF